SRLRNESNATRLHRKRGGVAGHTQPNLWIAETHTVPATDHDSRFASDPCETLRKPVVIPVGQFAAGEDRGRLRAVVNRLFQTFFELLVSETENDVIDRLRQIRQAGEAGYALDEVVFRVHRIDASRI